jgi:hypothetical protein
VVLLGSVFVTIPVNTREKAAPRKAWRLDPRRPRADGETTLSMVFAEAGRRHPFERATG